VPNRSRESAKEKDSRRIEVDLGSLSSCLTGALERGVGASESKPEGAAGRVRMPVSDW